MRHSPLDAEHRALGARMVPFGGWEMPLQYTGVLEEHRACREHAVVFDVSHLGSIGVAGPGAFDLLQWALSNDLRKVGVGRAQYTHLLDPDDAHVADDIIVLWEFEEQFCVMPNASNTDRIIDALMSERERFGVTTVADQTAGRATLAVQGPEARALLAKVYPGAATVGRNDVEPSGDRGLVSGTGYTGEEGVELQVPAADAPAVWHALVDAGITPAGLGARDTLRLEAGLPLHGHELGPGITPLQAGLGWVVGWDKGDFRGRAPLAAERERGISRRLRGLAIDGRRPARDGTPILRDGTVVGEVTSGNFSPTLGHAIALGFVPADVEPGDALQVDVRGQLLDARVVKLPFVKK